MQSVLELAARAAPLLRLAANGQAVAATSRQLGHGWEAAATSRRFIQGQSGLIPRRTALAFAVQLAADDEARLGQGDAAPDFKRCAPCHAARSSARTVSVPRATSRSSS